MTTWLLQHQLQDILGLGELILPAELIDEHLVCYLPRAIPKMYSFHHQLVCSQATPGLLAGAQPMNNVVVGDCARA
uniref:Uncharacterized protein n=1 Tax=Arundo donax TaxID=35708 RepID=A0A0A8YJH7_ARUDO